MKTRPDLSVILPCLNEEIGLEFCLLKINLIIKRMNISAEVIVVDNGSTDNSAAVALKTARALPRNRFQDTARLVGRASRSLKVSIFFWQMLTALMILRKSRIFCGNYSKERILSSEITWGTIEKGPCPGPAGISATLCFLLF